MTHETNSTLVLGTLVVVSSLALVHLARRFPLMRERVVLSEVASFTVTQRTMHWVIGVGSAVLFFTGLPVYLAQFLVIPSVATPLTFYYWGFQVLVWRTFHIYLALALVGVVVAHALWDTYRMKALARMTMSRADLTEQWSRARNFFGFSSARQGYHQSTAKYDSFQRAFHWTLLALGAFLLVSGLLMWEALTWNGVPLFIVLDRWNNWFMDDFMRTGHLVAAMLFAGLVVLHTYFALLPQNRSLLRSMTLGASARSQPVELDPAIETPDGRLPDHARVAKGASGGDASERLTQKSQRRMATLKTDTDPLRRSEPPHHDTMVIVGMLGAILLAALAVVFRTPGYILAPQRFETAYYWPFATFRVYYDVLIVELVLSAALCVITCLGSMFVLSSKREGVNARAPLYDRICALVGISFAAFVSSAYFIIAPFNVGLGLAASAAAAIIFWLVLREDGKSPKLGLAPVGIELA